MRTASVPTTRLCCWVRGRARARAQPHPYPHPILSAVNDALHTFNTRTHPRTPPLPAPHATLHPAHAGEDGALDYFEATLAVAAGDAGVAPEALPPRASVTRRRLPPVLPPAAARDVIKACVNWLAGELAGRLRDKGVALAASPVSPRRLGELVALVTRGSLSGKAGKEVLAAMADGDAAPPRAIMEARGWQQTSDPHAISALCARVVADPANAATLAKYRAGYERSFGALVAAALKASGGAANPGVVADALRVLVGPCPPRAKS